MAWLAQTQKSWRKNRRNWLTFLAFVAPNFILFGLFTYWPIIYSFYLSFTRWNFLTPNLQVVGFRNYSRLMDDDAFWEVLGNTLIYGLSVVLLAQGIAFLLALLLNRRVPRPTLLSHSSLHPTYHHHGCGRVGLGATPRSAVRSPQPSL